MDEVVGNEKAASEEEDKLEEIIEGEIGECQNMTQEYRQKQEVNNSKIFGLIRELTLKAKKEVEEEKQTREQTHE